MHTIFEDLKFRTTSFLSFETKESLKDALSNVVVVYHKGEFVVKYIDRDGQFECVKNMMPDIDADICDAEDHVNVVK